MAKKYHIRTNGSPGVCTAKPGNCPRMTTELGEQYHGTREEVTAEIERRHEEAYGPLGASLSESVMTVDEHGTKEWRMNGELHRTDGPAFEGADGYKAWYLNGERHREDGPAIEDTDGTKEWWVNGELHRIDGPAIERANGAKAWYANGELHREDGPAIERANGY